MRIVFFNREWLFSQQFLVPRVRTNVQIARFVVVMPSPMHRGYHKFYGVHVYLQSNRISLLSMHLKIVVSLINYVYNVLSHFEGMQKQ